MELSIVCFKHWLSAGEILDDNSFADPSSMKLDPSYKEWLALYPYGSPIEIP
jgi:hypothetical protein